MYYQESTITETFPHLTSRKSGCLLGVLMTAFRSLTSFVMELDLDSEFIKTSHLMGHMEFFSE